MLRLPSLADAAFFLRLTTDPEWLRFIGDRGVRNENDAADYVEGRLLPPFRDHGLGLFVVEARADRQALGICGLVKRPTLEHPDLGFALLPERRGQGYALEAGRAVLDDARARLGLHRILAITQPDNQASIRVLERLGMTDAGTFESPGAAPLRLFRSLKAE